jgi:hypothetical protein
VTRNDAGLMDLEFLFECCTRFLKERVKNPAHGKDGGAAINAMAIDLDLMKFSAKRAGPINDRDL